MEGTHFRTKTRCDKEAIVNLEMDYSTPPWMGYLSFEWCSQTFDPSVARENEETRFLLVETHGERHLDANVLRSRTQQNDPLSLKAILESPVRK